MTKSNYLATAMLALPLAFGGAASAQTPASKPNIVMIMADDVGIWNISAYHRGMMGGSTPNIDRIASEGALFTDYYAQQSCTAGRAAFILGQTPFRTGLLKVGMPAAKQGLQDKDPTIAELLKPLGYATAQIGKNHLGDRNEYLPTVHGFDEFYGILYHLNAMEEPYEPDYPKAPQFRASFGPRNIVDSQGDQRRRPDRRSALGQSRQADHRRWRSAAAAPEHGPRGQDQHGGCRRRTGAPLRRLHGPVGQGQQAVLPLAQLHAHPRLDPSLTEVAGQERLRPLRRRHDGTGLRKSAPFSRRSTISASPTTPSWCSPATTAPKSSPGRTAATHPFRGEKGTTYEGGFRVPMVVRWPGIIKPGTIINDIMAGEDWLPTFVAAAGDPDIKEKLLNGLKVGDKTFKTHLDGYNFMPFFKGEVAEGPRNEFFYFTDNGDLMALRYDDWKISFKTIKGNLFTGTEESTNVPLVTNLRQDPWERYQDQSMMYGRWWGDKLWTMVPAVNIVGGFLLTFKEYPPSQIGGSLSIEKALQMVQNGASGGGK